nr:MAG: hypothetical protein KatS3mg041_0551 [Bacteroidota bacterium]
MSGIAVLIRRGGFRVLPEPAEIPLYPPACFPPLDEGEQPLGGEEEVEQAPAEAERRAEKDEELASQEGLERHCELIRAEGFAEGYQKAAQEYESRYRERLQELEARLQGELTRLQAELEAFEEAMARMTVRLALRLAEKILDMPLDPERLEPVLRRRLDGVLARLAEAQPITVHVPPGWAQRFQVERAGLRWIEDADLRPGEFLVQTASNQYVLRFREALRQIEEELRWTDEVD